MHLLLLLLLAQEPPPPVSTCTFQVTTRIRVVETAQSAIPPAHLVETFVEYPDIPSYNSRAAAQARAAAIVASGYVRKFYLPGGAFSPEREHWYGPHLILRVQIVPQGFNGDDGYCVGQ